MKMDGAQALFAVFAICFAVVLTALISTIPGCTQAEKDVHQSAIDKGCSVIASGILCK